MTNYYFPIIYIVPLISVYDQVSPGLFIAPEIRHEKTSYNIKHSKNKFLYDLHYGFRAKRSCETQGTMLVEELHQNLKAGRQTNVLLLDFSKAFDNVSHEKL